MFGGTTPPRQKLKSTIVGIGVPRILADENDDAMSTITDDAALEPHAKPLVLFGDFDIGKSWFLKMVMTKLGLGKSSDTPKINEHTTKVIKFEPTKPTKDRHGDYHNFVFFDTEGLNQPRVKGQPAPSEFNHEVFALVATMPGVLIYMTNVFKVSDERMLKIVTSLVNIDRRIIVLHNRSADDVTRKAGIINNLLQYSNTQFECSGDSMSNTVNGHVIEHFFLFRHADLGIAYNENVFIKVLSILGLSRPVIVDNYILAAKDKCNLFNNALYDFTFCKTALGSIYVRFRILSIDEEKRPPVADDVTAARMIAQPFSYRAIDIRGNLDLDAITIDHVHESYMGHFMELSLSECEPADGARRPKTLKLEVWFPLIVADVVGSVVERNSRVIYVKVLPECNLPPSECKHKNTKTSKGESPKADTTKTTAANEAAEATQKSTITGSTTGQETKEV